MIAGATAVDYDQATTGILAACPAKARFSRLFQRNRLPFQCRQPVGVYNTRMTPVQGPQLGTAMYYKSFDFDIRGLAPVSVHFDLYNEKL
ncbi:MAG: hypothetical protein IPL72_16195 [Sulfuritalea sp.]|nr:hypothetical protein [Sulfuritalea sp.]